MEIIVKTNDMDEFIKRGEQSQQDRETLSPQRKHEEERNKEQKRQEEEKERQEKEQKAMEDRGTVAQNERGKGI
ncbi:hypothetical protein PG994_007211 [Apiospora phragmitis]|uniref:Uncharacterized protein n=1 Tax=Apiospora phragmitis TaxID=2905665 RepID=A0ABR1V053_9PEZI